jgi:hypothetical protein
VQQSAELPLDPSRVHDLDLRPSGAKDRSERYEIACTLDGVQVLGRPGPVAPGAPSEFESGLNAFDTPGVDARFTGPQLDLAMVPDNPRTSSPEASGPIHLVVKFPTDKVGRHEPLLSTGRTGEGDFVYVVYADDHHVRIGYDHWGVGGALSDPVAVDYQVPHEFWIRTGALYPLLGDDAAWHGTPPGLRQGLKKRSEIELDGTVVVSSAIPSYPSTPTEITVGHNRIGGSSADADFSGIVEFMERTGVAGPQPRGL